MIFYVFCIPLLSIRSIYYNIRHSSGESETDSLMSEDDTKGKKEEMKKSIFMKRKSNENLSISPRTLEESKKKSPETNKKKSNDEYKKKTAGSVSPRASEDKKSPERKNFNNPFSFTHAKKATNDIIQNEILKNEILKRKTEEMNLKNTSSLLVMFDI